MARMRRATRRFSRRKRSTVWTNGLSFGDDNTFAPTITLGTNLGGNVRGAAFELFTQNDLQDAGGERAVLARIRGQLAFHALSNEPAGAVRCAFVQRERDAAGGSTFLNINLFRAAELESEDILWMRQVYTTPMDPTSDDNPATDFTGVWGEVVNHSHRYIGVDVKAKRRMDNQHRVLLLVQSLGNAAVGPDNLRVSGYLRFLLLRAR